jgi:hypothetical protein
MNKKYTTKHKSTPDAPPFRAPLASILKFEKNRRSPHIVHHPHQQPTTSSLE